MSKILVIDDKESLRALLRYALGNGYVVLEARDGREGYEMFKSYNPDLIITDLTMPVMTGIEFVKKVRAVNADVWIIALSSSFHDQDEKGAMLNAGADICLLKPIALSFLELIVTHLLNIKRVDAAREAEILESLNA